jgi:DNA adenine methylase
MLSHQSFYAMLGSTWKCSKQRNMAKSIQSKKKMFARTLVLVLL